MMRFAEALQCLPAKRQGAAAVTWNSSILLVGGGVSAGNHCKPPYTEDDSGTCCCLLPGSHAALPPSCPPSPAGLPAKRELPWPYPSWDEKLPVFIYGSNCTGFDSPDQLRFNAKFDLSIYIFSVNQGSADGALLTTRFLILTLILTLTPDPNRKEGPTAAPKTITPKQWCLARPMPTTGEP